MKSTLRNFLYLLSLTPAIAVLIGNLNGGIFAWLNLFYILGVLAVIELFSPSIKSNLHSDSKDKFPDLILYLHVASQTLTLSSLFYGIYYGILKESSLIGATISTGIYGGQGAIIIAHELIHKHHRLKKLLGSYLLFTVGNVYFEIHHLRIHHRWVGTKKDAATANKNEIFYSFFVRSVWGQFAQAWQSESIRLGKSKKSAYSFYNGIVRRIIVQFIWLGLLYCIGGIVFPIIWIACGFVSSFLLEYVNYIEHYGLSRKESDQVTILHSWQTDKIISRFFLIDLNRHSDHHSHPSKPYHTLLSHDQSPVLPGGYASLILPALIPPIWFYIVNKRIPYQAE